MGDIIRSIVRDHGGLADQAEQLEPEADLYRAGLTSHASVNVMLALEDTFDLEFPDELLQRSTFQSIAAIEDALLALGVESSTLAISA